MTGARIGRAPKRGVALLGGEGQFEEAQHNIQHSKDTRHQHGHTRWVTFWGSMDFVVQGALQMQIESICWTKCFYPNALSNVVPFAIFAYCLI